MSTLIHLNCENNREVGMYHIKLHVRWRLLMYMIDFFAALKVSFVIQELTSAQPPVPAQALIIIIKRLSQQKRAYIDSCVRIYCICE